MLSEARTGTSKMTAKFGLIMVAVVVACLPALLAAGNASATVFTAACNVTSLRTALNSAAAAQGPHTINLDAGCTYRFNGVDSASNNDNALPVATRDITIE